jgi:hypothetical protein
LFCQTAGRNIKGFRFFGILFFILLTAALGGSFASCGIETYKYLNPVEPGIPMLLNTTAYISLPDEPYYFRYFVIYYRIYISNLPVDSSVDIGLLSRINPALSSDYNYFLSYTNTQSATVPTTMGSIFANRKYFSLELRDASIENILSNGGGVITLDFSTNPQFKPSLIVGDLRSPGTYPRYQLSRNTRNNNTPYANNYYFINSDAINNSAHISSDSKYRNPDVKRNDRSGAGAKYTYASMYIVAQGLDDTNFTNIYSIPTFIGIFRLPDQ